VRRRGHLPRARSSPSGSELIIETGIHDAIARKLNEKGKLSKNAIAEGIINNVRKTIIRDQLTDPKFYEEMSKLLNDLIQQRRNETLAYEDFLQRAEELVKRLARKNPADGTPAVLHGKPEAIVLFNNLASIPATTFQCPLDEAEKAELALEIDLAMREQYTSQTRSCIHFDPVAPAPLGAVECGVSARNQRHCGIRLRVKRSDAHA
jgi:type I restriction enzyme R subunit